MRDEGWNVAVENSLRYSKYLRRVSARTRMQLGRFILSNEQSGQNANNDLKGSTC